MNVKNIILLLLVFAESFSFGLTTDGRLIKERFELADFAGPTNRYTWVCPSQVSVSNQVFRIEERVRDGNYINAGIMREDGTVIGSCVVRITASSEDALDAICDWIMFGCAAPVATASAAWHVERDVQGNVMLFSMGRGSDGNVIERKRLRFYRTYGNLYVNIDINTDRVALGAWDFALPMIQAGLQPQQ